MSFMFCEMFTLHCNYFLNCSNERCLKAYFKNSDFTYFTLLLSVEHAVRSSLLSPKCQFNLFYDDYKAL